MRKIIWLLCLFFLLSGCNDGGETNDGITIPTENVNNSYSVVVIDSCQYVVFSRHEGVHNAHSSGITHKGNCNNPIHLIK